MPELTEDFNSLDASVWNTRDRQAYDRDDAVVLASNVSVSSGALRVQAKQESMSGRSYTSGDLDTFGTFSLPNYFRIEFRAKVPFEQGLWPAPLWIRPADGSSGEIDPMETYGRESGDPILHQTIHADYGTDHQQTVEPVPFSAFGGDATGWNTYVVQKTKGEIRMWCNDVQTAVFNESTTPWFDTYYEAGKRWSLRISLQVGGSYGGLPDLSTDWSPEKTAMFVDYIHAFVPS